MHIEIATPIHLLAVCCPVYWQDRTRWSVLINRKNLEHVWDFGLRRKRANFVLIEAKFTVVVGLYGENFNEK
jgi:hypothetical protein